MTDPWPTDIAARIRAARAYANLSQPELGKRLGYGKQTVLRIESGHRLPRAPEVRELARIAGLPFEFFTADLNGLAEVSGASGEQPQLQDLLDELARVRAELALLRAAQEPGEAGSQAPPRKRANGNGQANPGAASA